MLNSSSISDINAHLDRAQNPLFFFDNDNDGLTSFLIFRRHLQRGKGVPIKSFPDLNISYYRKVNELRPDYIFVLDKPLVSPEFISRAKDDNLPLVWIDHHNIKVNIDTTVHYYNPYPTNKSSEPVSYLAYRITNSKEDIWLALIGSISDCFIPDFYPEFYSRFPDLGLKNPVSAFDLLYKSEIGRIARILDFALKDSTTNVINMIKFMMNVKGPLDIIQENIKTRHILRRFSELDTKYQELMTRARNSVMPEKHLLYFQYGGTLSLSANLANQLIYEYPDKLVVVAYINSEIANISIRGRGESIRHTLSALNSIDSATAGGHESAIGAKLNVSDLPEFIKLLEKSLL